MSMHPSSNKYIRALNTLDENPLMFRLDSERFESVPELRLWCEVAFRADAEVQTYLITLKPYLWSLARHAQIWIHSSLITCGSLIWIAEECFPNFSGLVVNTIRKRTPLKLPPPLDIEPFETQTSVVKYCGKVQTSNYEKVKKRIELQQQYYR